MDLIQTLEHEEIARLAKTIPEFAPGDTVIVSVSVVEGTRKRLQAFEGVVIAKRNRSLNSSFIVRKVSSGEGVERTFQTYSPLIASIEVKRRGDVRRAKLYYLREPLGQVGADQREAGLTAPAQPAAARQPASPASVIGSDVQSRGPARPRPRRPPAAGRWPRASLPAAIRLRFAAPPHWQPEIKVERRFIDARRRRTRRC